LVIVTITAAEIQQTARAFNYS